VLQIRLSDPAQYQSIVDAEWNIIYDKLAKCAESGANIVLSRLAIGDLATQYFADRGIFCAGRVGHPFSIDTPHARSGGPLAPPPGWEGGEEGGGGGVVAGNSIGRGVPLVHAGSLSRWCYQFQKQKCAL